MNPVLDLIPCPIILAVLAVFDPRPSRLTRIGAALMWVQFAVAALLWWPYMAGTKSAWIWEGFSVDRTAAFFVILTTLVVSAALTHSVGFFEREACSEHPPAPQHITQVYLFVPLFLLAMYSVVCADNLGYLWIGMEATTLLSAPLVYFRRSRGALEATWKYLIICSVGIAFGFMGTAILYAASQRVPALAEGTLSLSVLAAHARDLPTGMVRLGFAFVLLGYGTKAGLFPLHSWLPDAHSASPSPVSALLSGALLNCALVSLWRVSDLARAAGQGLLVRETLLPMGVATTLAAAFFLLKQNDIKRLLAYSSMENVGLMAVAIALGFGPGFLLQAVNHSIVKVALFLLAGNLIQQFGTKTIRDMKGLLTARPAQGILLFLLLAAVAGTPPFGSFLSEWRILASASDGGHVATTILLLFALALGFVALAIQSGDILFGPASHRGDHDGVIGQPANTVPTILLACSLCLGLLLTPSLVSLALEATR